MPVPNPATMWLLLAVVVLILAAGALIRLRNNEGLSKEQLRQRDEAWDREIGPW